MNQAEYNKLYESDPEIKDYVDRVARSYRSTPETVLKWAIVHSYIENKKGVRK